MDFETFLSKARSVPNVGEAIPDLPPEWDFPAIVFPGGLYCEADDFPKEGPIYYAEIGSERCQSVFFSTVAKFLYEFACDEELLEEEV